MPMNRRTPVLVAAALAASALVAIPASKPAAPESVTAQSGSAVVPVDIAPRQLPDSDYLARAAAAQRKAQLAADSRAAAAAASAAAAEQARLERAAARKARLAEQRRASRSRAREAAPTRAVAYGSPRAIARDQLAARGWSDQFGCLDNLWTKESGWRTTASNPSGAYGIPQALPGSKMASAGSDWRTNPATQIRWGLGYIGSRYGDPCGAWSHFQRKGWY